MPNNPNIWNNIININGDFTEEVKDELKRLEKDYLSDSVFSENKVHLGKCYFDVVFVGEILSVLLENLPIKKYVISLVKKYSPEVAKRIH